MNLRPNWFIRTFDALSQLLNVVIFNGDANESISGRAWREKRLIAVKVIDSLIFWEKEHCKKAYDADMARAKQLVKR